MVTKVIDSQLQTLEEHLDARLLAWLIKTHLNWLRQAKLTAGIDFDIDRGIYEHVMVAAKLNISTFRRWSFAHLFYRYGDLNFLYPWADQGVGATKQRLNPVSYELLFMKESRIFISCLFLHGLLHVFLLRRNGTTLTKKDINEVKEFFRRGVTIGAALELIEVPWISRNCTANLRLTQGHFAHLHYGATLVAPWGEKTDDRVLVRCTPEPRKNGGFRIRETTLYRRFSATIYVENEDRNLKLYWLSPFTLLKLGSVTLEQMQHKIEEISFNPRPAWMLTVR
jgi:hypothetical protein